MAALLHDIQDWKYSGSETAGATAIQVWLRPPLSSAAVMIINPAATQVCGAEQEFLQQHAYPEHKQQAVLDVITGVGFKVLALVHQQLACCVGVACTSFVI